MDYIKELYDMCETIVAEITDANEKIRSAGGKLTAGDVDYIDKLTHTLKSIKAVVAMGEEEEYSNRGSYMPYGEGGGSYRNGGGSYRQSRASYARGRGSNASRDSMGRYSGRGYSRDEGLADELRELMEDAPNEAVRRDMQKLLEKVEQM